MKLTLFGGRLSNCNCTMWNQAEQVGAFYSQECVAACKYLPVMLSLCLALESQVVRAANLRQTITTKFTKTV